MFVFFVLLWSAESTTQTDGTRPLHPSSPAPVTRATASRDWGTSPGRFPGYDQSQSSHEDVPCERSSHRLVSSLVPPLREQGLPPPQASALQSSSSLDQLWERFCSRWYLEDSQPASDGEASLLERLERLSRLIHDARRSKGEEEAQRDGGKTQSYPSIQAWRMEEPSEPSNHSLPSTRSHGGPHLQHLCPADREETDAPSTSGSVSTVDTGRLVRAFGPHRVQLLKTTSSLRRLYSTIDEQKVRREERGGGAEEQPSSLTASHITEDSAVST